MPARLPRRPAVGNPTGAGKTPPAAASGVPRGGVPRRAATPGRLRTTPRSSRPARPSRYAAAGRRRSSTTRGFSPHPADPTASDGRTGARGAGLREIPITVTRRARLPFIGTALTISPGFVVDAMVAGVARPVRRQPRAPRPRRARRRRPGARGAGRRAARPACPLRHKARATDPRGRRVGTLRVRVDDTCARSASV